MHKDLRRSPRCSIMGEEQGWQFWAAIELHYYLLGRQCEPAAVTTAVTSIDWEAWRSDFEGQTIQNAKISKLLPDEASDDWQLNAARIVKGWFEVFSSFEVALSKMDDGIDGHQFSSGDFEA